MAGILDYLNYNPHGWGNGPALAQPEIAYQDDAGNLYGYNNKLLQRWQPEPQRSWGDTALDILTAPAKVTTGLAEALSPYGAEGWQVPPAIQEPINAASRLSNAGGLPNPQDPQNRQDALTLLLSMYGGNATGAALRGGEALASRALSDTGKPSLLGSALAGAEHPGITAYHGSPHDFDRFSMDKIGTGEGAQAFGHGLYFADSEDVARSYRDSLSTDGLGTVARGRLRQHGGDIDKTLEYLRSRATEGDQPFAVNNRQAIAELEQAKAAGSQPGHLYQVRINAEPEQFLDWDKPLLQQSEGVRNAVLKFADTLKAAKAENAIRSAEFEKAQAALQDAYTPGLFGEKSAATKAKAKANYDAAYQRMIEVRALRGDLDASKWDDVRSVLQWAEADKKLAEAGIPGIRYLDQGSRGKGEGSYNYVVFDDSIIDILKKYGLAGLIGGSGAFNDHNASERY